MALLQYLSQARNSILQNRDKIGSCRDVGTRRFITVTVPIYRDGWQPYTRLNVKTYRPMICTKAEYPDSLTKYKFYLKYFKENFNLHFGRSQKDSSCTCEDLVVKIRSPFFNDAAKRISDTELMAYNIQTAAKKKKE